MPVIVGFFIIMLLNSVSFANDCRAVHWPFSKEIKSLQPLSLQAIPRDHLYKYLYNELSSVPAQRVAGLASKIFYYLKNTELNEDKYQMLMALEWASDLNTPKPRVIPISEICSIEDKINREPSSTKKVSRKKTQKAATK